MATVAVVYNTNNFQGVIKKPGTVARVATFVDSVIFDAIISEQHSGEVQVTENPVERGIDVTDNIRPKPEQLTLDALVSNAPLDPSLLGDANNPKRASEAFRVLRELRDAGTLVTVVTGLRTYDSMVIKRLDVNRDKKTGQALAAKIQLIQILQADTKLVPKPVPPRGNGDKNAGKKQPKQSTTEQRKTVAKRFVGFVKGGG